MISLIVAVYGTSGAKNGIPNDCESQEKAHVKGNVSVGNDKETLISAITQCLPYIGFPRTLNALSCINEVIPEN